MDNSFFRVLSAEEEVEFRAWARENFLVGEPVNEVWHPVVRDECRLMMEEADEAKNLADRASDCAC